MSVGSNRLPIELWEEIFSHVLYRSLFPSTNATIFDEMDLFSHPCKIYVIYSQRVTLLRLVCRLWNEIIGAVSQVFFEDGRWEYNFRIHGILSSRRVELITRWNDYCRKWPCSPLSKDCRTSQGRCIPGRLSWYDIDDTAKKWVDGLDGLVNVRVLRLFHDVRGPIRILEKCANLEALWIHLAALQYLMRNQLSSTVERLRHLSHLYIDTIIDTFSTYTLHLPNLTYLEMKLHLETTYLSVQHPVFPLDLRTPNITTIVLSGVVSNAYTPYVEKYINSCRSSVAHLLLSYTGDDSAPFLPPDQLFHFPRLNTLGLKIGNIISSSNHDFAMVVPPSSSPFSLVLFGLEDRPTEDNLDICKQKLQEMVGVHDKWFSKVFIPMEWAELWDPLVGYCRGTFRGDSLPPSYCTILDDLNQNGVSIQDRNGVGLHDWDGLDLIRAMRGFSRNTTRAADREVVLRIIKSGPVWLPRPVYYSATC
ncbi:hypothetical protein FRC18_001016 [Serendipita sp. 400]|nr:hypothetical protein FRC18_001016 [Serendipita sp. 400]